MREAFKVLAGMLRKNHVKPADVVLTIRFDNSRDRDKIAFAIGKELTGLQPLSGTPDHVYGGNFYGIVYDLQEATDA